MAEQAPKAGPNVTAGSEHRESRWMGQGYADITKLREIAARHQRAATRNQARAARIQTRMEKLRHTGTLLREKAQKVLAAIPQVEQQMSQHDQAIKAATQRSPGLNVGSDVTSLHYKNRKLQQKIVNMQHRSRTLEHHAAQRAQKAAELKIKCDRYLEQSKVEEQEAQNYLKRADRLQMATEAEFAARRAPAETTASTETPTGPA
jgi:predicted  nucleic acid-binding Zn-ribbon protein